jgi:hypothetical protein
LEPAADVMYTAGVIVVWEVALGFYRPHVSVRLEGYKKSSLVYYEGVLEQDWTRIQGIESTWVVRPNVDALSVAFAGR